MSHNKVHSRVGNVPFSWEKQPGISKDQTKYRLILEDDDHDHGVMIKLPPPPCPPPVIGAARISVDGGYQYHIPPPPAGTFSSQPLSRSSSAKGFRNKQDDPFLAAFRVCTKSARKGKTTSSSSSLTRRLFDLRSGMMRSLFAIVPCKSPRSCAVRDDNLVRVSQLPYDVYDRER